LDDDDDFDLAMEDNLDDEDFDAAMEVRHVVNDVAGFTQLAGVA
jgi:hypothetical protein